MLSAVGDPGLGRRRPTPGSAGVGDWVLALPGHYVAGLMVLARTVLGRTRAWPVRSDLRDLPATVAHLTGRRYLSVVPTQLSRARREDRVWEALGTFDAVLVGGGRAEPGLLAEARASGIAVVPTYGMSETCGGCVYAGLPLDGVEVVVADGGQILIGGRGAVLRLPAAARPDPGHPAWTAGWPPPTAAAGRRPAARCWAGGTTW